MKEYRPTKLILLYWGIPSVLVTLLSLAIFFYNTDKDINSEVMLIGYFFLFFGIISGVICFLENSRKVVVTSEGFSSFYAGMKKTSKWSEVVDIRFFGEGGVETIISSAGGVGYIVCQKLEVITHKGKFVFMAWSVSDFAFFKDEVIREYRKFKSPL